MKRFLLMTVSFCVIVVAGFLLLLSRADGHTDAFYLRFTTPRQPHLIVGTSRAGQGLRPAVLREELGIDLFNYGFTLGQSPYGAAYFESIRRKLDPATRNGVFIVTVDPWCLASTRNVGEDTTRFRELSNIVGTTRWVNVSPNLEYLVENLTGRYYTVLERGDGELYLHADGWLEVTVPMDTATVLGRRARRLATYRDDYIPIYIRSEVREMALQRTIQLLKAHGHVYMVRLPVDTAMYALEQAHFPAFDGTMERIARQTDGYWDMSPLNAEFRYNDGNHLNKEAAREVSHRVGQWIHQQEQERR